MQLQDYPQEIADLQLEVLKLERKLRTQRETLAFCTNVIDRAIAFNVDLKNDNQRKAYKTELMEKDSDYIQASNKLKQLEDLHGELEVDLQLLRNTFSLLKLERREAIARMELSATTAA